jgi:hypothetical protein
MIRTSFVKERVMTLDAESLRRATELTERDRSTPRTEAESDILLDRFVAEFVAESESMEGHATKASEVFDSVRDLALGT